MIRLSLIFLIIFLVARIFIVYGQRKGVPKSLGEYVDYEEVDKSG
jgi:hypothetical protein